MKKPYLLTTRRNSRCALRMGLLLTMAVCAGRAAASEIMLDGVDVTRRAAPLERSRVLLVNVSALASALGLRVDFADGAWKIRDADGAEWTARIGQPYLDGARRFPLLVPPTAQGASLYLPVEAAAELAGARVKADAATHSTRLTLRREDTVASAAGWQGFTLEKPASEQEAKEAPEDGRRAAPFVPLLPGSQDRLRFDLGLGLASDAGPAMELTAEGRYLGANVRFASQMTLTASGLRARGARFLWEDQAMGKSLEAGSLYSDLWGGVSGVRFAWKAGKENWPAVSLYEKPTTASRSVVAFRDDFHPLRYLWIGGEVATDGSLCWQGRFHLKRWEGAFYSRHLTGASGGNSGGLFSYDLGRGIGLYADISQSRDSQSRSEWRSVGLRLPVSRFADVTLERSLSRTDLSSSRSDAVIVSLPLGPLRLYTRYQWRSAALFNGQSGAVFGLYSREMQTSALYFVNPRLRFEFQRDMVSAIASGSTNRDDRLPPFQSNAGSICHAVSCRRPVRKFDIASVWSISCARDLALTLDYGFQLSQIRTGPSTCISVRAGR